MQPIYKKMYLFDLETCIMKAGHTRKQVIMLSIGVVNLLDKTAFHCFVKTDKGREHEIKSAPTQSIKKKIKYSDEKALPVDVGIRKMFQFCGKNPMLMAHNGKSFDFPILLGNMERENTVFPFEGLDTYHYVVKKVFSLPSYKLSNVYYSICNNHSNYKFHTAVDDCLCLREVVIQSAKTFLLNNLRSCYIALYKGMNDAYGVNLKYDMQLCPQSKIEIEQILNTLETNTTLLKLIMIHCIRVWSGK